MLEVPMLPPSQVGNLPVIEMMINDTGPYRMLVDTAQGTPFTATLPERTATAAKLERLGLTRGALSVEKSQAAMASMDVAKQSTITIGGRTMVAPSFAIMKDSTSFAVLPDGREVDGILGAGFMREHVVSFDFVARTIDFDATPGSADTAFSVKIAFKQPLVITDAFINDSGALPMIIETGAAQSSIWSPVAENARLPVLEQRVEVRKTINADTAEAQVKRLRMGSHSVCNINVKVSEAIGRMGSAMRRALTGQVGVDLLSGTRLTIDYPKERLWLTSLRADPDCSAPAAPGSAAKKKPKGK